MSETDPKFYQEELKKLYTSLKSLNRQVIPISEEAGDIYERVVTIENVLETLLNWIRIEKATLRNLDTIIEWMETLVNDENVTIDEIRYRLRVLIIPQIESFVQNISTGERSALKVVDTVTKELEKLPEFLKTIQQQNFKILTLLGYEPQENTTHIDSALYNLYQARFEEYNKELKKLNEKLPKL